ncbi:hypothetical protein CsSME_00024354 [Camellia sinensis var. sinensis]
MKMFRSRDVVFHEDHIIIDFEKFAKSRVVISSDLFPCLEPLQHVRVDEVQQEVPELQDPMSEDEDPEESDEDPDEEGVEQGSNPIH